MKRATRLLQCLVIVAFLPLMAHAQFDHAFLWTQAGGMQDLGVLQGWQNSVADAISNTGEVVGSDSNSGTTATAFRWSSGAGMQHLSGTDTTFVAASAVNDSGTVAGTYHGSGSTANRCFIWTQANGFEDIGSLGSGICGVAAINRSGQVVGSSEKASGATHGFLWTQSGGMQDLGTFLAFAINDHGVIVGTVPTANGRGVAAIWNKGKISMLAPGFASGINNQGQVTGTRPGAQDNYQAFVWNPGDGSIQLIPLPPDAIDSYGQKINGSGEVAGWSMSDQFFSKAFVWTPSGGLVDIGNLGGEYGAVASAINDAGQVVGYSTIP
jgi:probable HAF family extracellular repeat protein